MEKSKFIILLLNKIRRQLASLIVEDGWKENSGILTIIGWSYIPFWEIISRDTAVIQKLKNIGIPCEKDMRNTLAHAGSVDAEKLIKYAEAFTSGDFADLVLSYVNTDLDAMIAKYNMTGAYGTQIDGDAFGG